LFCREGEEDVSREGKGGSVAGGMGGVGGGGWGGFLWWGVWWWGLVCWFGVVILPVSFLSNDHYGGWEPLVADLGHFYARGTRWVWA